jgi:hypothetical protein
MFDWIKRRHKELEQSKESPSTEAVKKFLDDIEKFLDDLDDLSFLDMVPWRLVPWNLEENDFAEFLEKLISHRTRLELEVQLDQLVRQIKKSDKERDEHSKVAADTGLAQPVREIAEFRLQQTKRRAERLENEMWKLKCQKWIFGKIARDQKELVVLHPSVTTGSVTSGLASLHSLAEEIETGFKINPSGELIYGPVCILPHKSLESRISEIKKLTELEMGRAGDENDDPETL